jgi:hypothetical protein
MHPASILVVRYLPLHAAVFGTIHAIARPGAITAALAAALWVSGFLAVEHRRARVVSFLLCIGAAAALFPVTPNHGYLLCAALGVGALFDERRDDERASLEHGLVGLAAVVLFWSGAQKLLAGTWTGGQLWAYEIGRSPRFAGALGWLLSGEELRAVKGSGPFLASTPILIAGNGVWLLEIASGLGLLSSRARARRAAALAALALLFAIEAVARESVFGIVMAALLLPATGVKLRAVWLWWLVPLELLAIAGRLSLVPGGFH